jgi:carbonic anhydrase/acetyltransferase-like protein (isoleucine patch superfamily)
MKYRVGTNQSKYGIDIHILDDEQDNFDFLKNLLPPEIWNCLSEHGKKTPITPKPSMLPQVMFLSNLSIYATKTENVNSIVCLDRFTTLRAPSIKGNIFLNDNSNVNISADMIGPAQGVKSHLGEGSIFGISSEVNSVSFGSNTVICGKASLDFDTIVNDGCVIGNGVKISRGQTVMAGQKITATLPLSLSIMRNAAMFSLEDFLRLSEVRRHLLLSGEIS